MKKPDWKHKYKLLSIEYEKLAEKSKNAILQPHYDNHGRLDGGWVIENGVCTGHIDPCGEPGAMGEPDIPSPPKSRQIKM